MVRHTIIYARQENASPVRSCKQAACNTILGCPYMRTIGVQFFRFVGYRHTPSTAPVGCCGIVACFEGCQVVGETVVAEVWVVAILGHRLITSVTILVCAPLVCILWRCFAPSKIVAHIFGRGCSYIHCRPVCFARQAEVNKIESTIRAIGCERFYCSVASTFAVGCVCPVVVGCVGCKSGNCRRELICVVGALCVFRKVFAVGAILESTRRNIRSSLT